MKNIQILLYAGGLPETHSFSVSIRIKMTINQILLWAGKLPQTHSLSFLIGIQTKAYISICGLVVTSNIIENRSDSVIGWWAAPDRFPFIFN